MSTLSERIRWVMQTFSLTQAELARICGIKQPSVNRWVSGDTETIKSDSALRLCERYPINIQWLISGIGEPLFDGEAPKNSTTATMTCAQAAVRFFYPAAQADPQLRPKLEEMQMIPRYYDPEWLKENNLLIDNLKAFIAPDDGMSPFINKGDSVTIDTTQTTIENNRVYVFVYMGALYVRRLRVLLNGDIQTVTNGSWPNENIPKERVPFVHVLGRVVDRFGNAGL